MGKNAILAIARHNPEHIYLGGRNASKCAVAIEEIKSAVPNAAVTFLECDLGSLTSVANAAAIFKAQSSRLDIIMCNAGILDVPFGLTSDGYEVRFGTNHPGHALLIKLLLPTLLQTAA